jgi:uncharacterized cupredoxin-like copper-binding protein
MLAAEVSAVVGIIATFAFVLFVLSVVLYALVRPFTHFEHASGRRVGAFAMIADRRRLIQLAVATAAVTSVVASGLVTTGEAVTSKPLVAVQVDEFSVFPGTQGAPRGKVRFVVTNIGTVKHEFVVLRTAKPAGNLLKGNEADESGNVGEIGGVPPGQARTLNLTLKPGHYSLICNLPGHYKTGQFADFYVR